MPAGEPAGETLASVAADIPVERYGGFPIDAKFLYERNLGDLRSLAGRKIALIGCGTIGRFLAAYVAQSGVSRFTGQYCSIQSNNRTGPPSKRR
jgi:hypothetical protein